MSRFIYKQENLLNKEGLTPIAQNMKRAFDNNIFVNFIPLEVTEDQLRQHFGQTGQILQLRMIQKP